LKQRRFVGYLFLSAAVVGFIFAIFGLFEIWSYLPRVAQSVTNTLHLYDQTLMSTQSGLKSIGLLVETTKDDVASLQVATQALAATLHDTAPMIDSLTNLTGKDLPAAISTTQTSLSSAQSSALLIDNALAAITSIPFLPVAIYKPEVPLHTALAQVSTSLDSINPALVTITSSLGDSKTNLGVVEVELNHVADTTKVISEALGDAKNVIGQYATVTDQLKVRVEYTGREVSGWITTLAWILTFLLGWFLFAQLALFMYGLDLLHIRSDLK
jgi:hypothetical protein